MPPGNWFHKSKYFSLNFNILIHYSSIYCLLSLFLQNLGKRCNISVTIFRRKPYFCCFWKLFLSSFWCLRFDAKCSRAYSLI